MALKPALIAYAATALVFLALDAAWLTTMASRLYRPELGALMLDRPVMAPAVAFYLLYLVAVIVFAVMPGLEAGRWTTALWRGALFGLAAYATYDLTNQATLAGWSWRVTLADLCWGTFVTGVAAAAGCRLTAALTGEATSS